MSDKLLFGSRPHECGVVGKLDAVDRSAEFVEPRWAAEGQPGAGELVQLLAQEAESGWRGDSFGAEPADLLVGRDEPTHRALGGTERRGRISWSTGQLAGQYVGTDDGQTGALARKRRRAERGILEQCDAPVRPASSWTCAMASK